VKAELIASGVRPSAHPQREEVVAFNYFDRELGQAFSHHRIVRDGGKTRLERGELIFPDRCEGRFTL